MLIPEPPAGFGMSPRGDRPERLASTRSLGAIELATYWAHAQALAPESAQICDAIWLCSCGEALCGEPWPP